MHVALGPNAASIPAWHGLTSPAASSSSWEGFLPVSVPTDPELDPSPELGRNLASKVQQSRAKPS